MKKFGFKKIFVSFLVFASVVTGFFGIKSKNNARAETSLPEYFNVSIVTDSSSNAIEYQNDCTYFLESGQRFQMSFTSKNITVSHFTQSLSINDKLLQTIPTDEYGIEIKQDQSEENIYSFTLNPYSSQFEQGKYTVDFKYWETQNGNQAIKTLSCTFYIFKASEYTGSQVATFSKQPEANGTYLYTYKNNSDQKDQLIYLDYNYKNYNLKISKVYQNLTYSTNVSFVKTNENPNGEVIITNIDEFGNPTNLNYVLVSKKTDSKLTITFKDLGEYYITYIPINPYGNCEELSNFYNNVSPKKQDTLHIYGYQAFLTSENQTEFKNLNSQYPYLIKDYQNADVSNYVQESDGNITLETEIFETNGTNNIVKTNQAPVYFSSNCYIKKDQSFYYWFKDIETFKNSYNELKVKNTRLTNSNDSSLLLEDYQATPLSKLGIYLVKLAYSLNSTDENATNYQYFLFEITSSSPELNIYEVIPSTEPDTDPTFSYLPSNSFTNKSVLVKKSETSIFDSPCTLKVYKDSNFTNSNFTGIAPTIIENPEGQTFSDNGKYKVELIYGNKNFEGQYKNYVSYFTIDDSQIENIQFRTADKINTLGDLYQFGQTLNENVLITNKSVAISWAEKLSGAKTYAQYKFFPINYSSQIVNSLTNDEIKAIYTASGNTQYGIVSSYGFNYTNGNIPVSDYENTINKNLNISESSLLNQSGIYIIKFYDQANPEGQYKVIIIDKSPANLLKINNEQYSIINGYQMPTSDYKILFGKNKLIRFQGLNLNSTELDSWFKTYFLENYSSYLAEFKGNVYLTIENYNKVYYTINQNLQTPIVLSSLNQYGYQMKAFENGLANEKQYEFYCINTNNNFIEDSFDYFSKNYTQRQMVHFTTDNSKMTLTYKTSDNKTVSLDQIEVYKENNTKYNYFNPTGYYTLVNSDDILNFGYTTQSESFKVETIVLKYYAFEKDSTNTTYVFNNAPTTQITIYDRTNNINIGTAKDQNYSFVWDLLKETFSQENNIEKERTKSGKYIIERTYTDDSLNDANDPKNRTLVFIVDRNGIISTPEFDQNNNLLYFVGSGIKLQVLNNSKNINDKTLFFYDLYYASKMNTSTSGSMQAVLTTNLLPVTVYVPAYKYGYDLLTKNIYSFNNEQSITKYTEGKNLNIEAYKLTATVYYYGDNPASQNAIKTYDLNNITDENYLNFNNDTKLISFNEKGYYKVLIHSKGSKYDTLNKRYDDEFSFVFKIEYKAPEYSLLDENNNPLNSDENGVYYTNKQKVRIAWSDSESKYLANINQNEIKFSINQAIFKVDPTKIVQPNKNEKYYYVDLDLSNFYNNNQKVDITLQFLGEQQDYNSDYFSKTTSVIIDTKAPIQNLNRLIEKSGFEFYDLRNYVQDQKYNISKNDGILQFYSFVVDKQNFSELLYSSSLTNFDYFKVFYKTFEDQNGNNTKYVIGKTQESDITYTNHYSSHQSSETYDILFNDFLGKNYLNKYIEIIEEDYAGNRTVFTIYISDFENLKNEYVLQYTTNETTHVKFNQLESNLDLYSKYNLNLDNFDAIKNDNLNGKYYNVVKIENVKYIKTPYSDLYYNPNYFTNLENSQGYTLQEITKLSSSSNKQTITLYNIPKFNTVNLNCYVLNKTLEFVSLSNFIKDNSKEGIIIKLPVSNDPNTLFATKLEIMPYINNNLQSKIIIDNQNYFKQENEVYNGTNYKIYYTQAVNGTYMVFEYTGNLNQNDYFIYNIFDNFNESYNLAHIYGQTEITNPVTSTGEIKHIYKNENLIYYSSSNIIYKFDTTIYSGNTEIQINYNGNSKTFFISNNMIVNDDNGQVQPEIYETYFSLLKIKNVMSIELKQSQINVSADLLGQDILYTVTLTPNTNFNIDPDIKRFNIYNKIPKFYLIGKNGENITSILGNKNVYSQDITISYEKTTLEYPYSILIATPDSKYLTLENDFICQDKGTYKIIINYLGDLAGLSKILEFTITKIEDYKYSVVTINDDGTYSSSLNPTNKPFVYQKDGYTLTEDIHYLVNDDYTIILNNALNLILENPDGEIVGPYSKLYKIKSDYNSSLNSNYIAPIHFVVTKIDNSYDILSEFIEYESSGNPKYLLNETSTISYQTTETGFKEGRRIVWSKYYLIPENKINVSVYYSEIDKVEFIPNIMEDENYYYITLKQSGVYYFKFTDLAGNVHLFGEFKDTQYFTIKYVSSVIFEMNDQTPINHSYYNQSVKISIPLYTLDYYDTNSKPLINVELNGKVLDIKTNLDYTWIFEDAGLYKIYFDARHDNNLIYRQPIYFTILSENETRLVYSYSGHENYYIEDILSGGQSLYPKLANQNVGNLYLNKYLKNITLSKDDIKTGVGKYTFVINTNNEFNQKFTFSVWINDPSIPLVVSHKNGVQTDKTINIKFTTKNLLQDAGDCIIKITGRENLYITQEDYDAGLLKEIYEINLSEKNHYYVEITTLSGQLLYSSHYIKVDPLNTMTIILIVIGVILFVTLTVTFILLRKKMKVR